MLSEYKRKQNNHHCHSTHIYLFFTVYIYIRIDLFAMCIEKIPTNAGNLSSNSSFNGDILEFETPDYVDEFQDMYYSMEMEEEPSTLDIFNEYLWMENEEEFEEEEMQRLEEQELILQCNSAMDELALLDDIRQLECEHHKE